MMKRAVFISTLAVFMALSPLSGQENADFLSKLNFNIDLSLLTSQDEFSPGGDVKAWYFIKERLGVGPSGGYWTSGYSSIDARFINYGMSMIGMLPVRERLMLYGEANGGFVRAHVPNFGSAWGGETAELHSSMFYQPGVGIIMTTPSHIGIKLGISYYHHSTDIIYNSWGWGSTTQNLAYNRIKMSFGLVF